MSQDDISYLRQRYEAELELAQQSSQPEAVKAHRRFAQAYLERITSAEKASSNEDG